jgi:hypothetical protein
VSPAVPKTPSIPERETMTTAKVFTTRDIKALNSIAISEEKNRALNDEAIASLDPEGAHVVFFSMFHTDSEYRLGICLKFAHFDTPVEGWLDVDVEDYEKYGIEINYTPVEAQK